MKKIAASVGMIALGASCVRAADEPFVSADAGKIWRVSASLRGFYDDNVNTATTSSAKLDSFGFSIAPALNLNWQRDQNTLSLSYVYQLLWYERLTPGFERTDQQHIFNASFNHAFSERYSVKVADSFTVGQEPDALRSGDAFTAITRQPGNNYRNDGTISFIGQLTPLFGFDVGYENAVFFYHDKGAIVNFPYVSPSEAGSLDQMDHTIHLDGTWLVQPETTAILEYQYRMVDFTGNELIKYSLVNNVLIAQMSDSRNVRSHYIDLGADHNFSPEMQGSVRAGVRINDYYNDPTQKSEPSPYARAGFTYKYAPESFFTAGFSYDRNSTDWVGSGTNTTATVAQQSANIYATINHRLLPKLYGSLSAQLQDATFVGGPNDGQSERYFLLGLNFQYRFTQYLSADLGYNYDKVSSDVGRSFDRNKVYIGFTGSY